MTTKYRNNVIGLALTVFALETAASGSSQAGAPQGSSRVDSERSTPAALHSGAILRAGTPITLIFADNLSSANTKEGTPVSFILANSLSIHGSIIVDAGAKAFGKVTSVVRAKPPGRSGALNIEVAYLQTGNHVIPLCASPENGAKNEIRFAAHYNLKFPLGLLRGGDDVDIHGGMTFATAYLAEDVHLPLR
jgi:hypothetical protein